ncbi:hypothetical protein BQ8794_240230 [Mesorhizobium prunaredense]|uniref:Methionyl/Leucyl tRNA synthetase domain-containing protein n=1 Tax=Mesorhizobium prunaredense TaxID=1631249 RepID=A0A1R3V803_9HYPH|nr:hypothetical protein BQ8794_240230 [Mesorhizobium prunaredense]
MLGRDWNAALPSNDWQIVHFFGFDNSFYHALLYPALYAEVFSQRRDNSTSLAPALRSPFRRPQPRSWRRRSLR